MKRGLFMGGTRSVPAMLFHMLCMAGGMVMISRAATGTTAH